MRTYRAKVDIDDVVPNERQPRLGPKEDESCSDRSRPMRACSSRCWWSLTLSCRTSFGLSTASGAGRIRSQLVAQGREQYRQIPVEVTDRTLTDEERLRVWIYIHRQRKEWDAREKEMVAYRLVDLIGRASAANILGISIRELDKLTEVFELSARFKGLRDPAGAITWARELMGVSKKLLTPTVIDAVVEKVAAEADHQLEGSAKLAAILPDPVAREHFLSEQGDIDSAMLRLVRRRRKDKSGLAGDLSCRSSS